METDKEKFQIFLKKYIPFVITALISLIAGFFLSYYTNPKCGIFKEKTQYLVKGIRSLFDEEDEIEIVQQCEECICPECTIEKEEEITDSCPIKIDVSGAVRNPGVYCFQESSVIMDAVDKAGGFLADYGYKFIYRKINLAEELVDNEKIYFPFKEDLSCELLSFATEVEKEEVIIYPKEKDSQSKDTEKDSSGSENSESNDDCISINNAILEELVELNGVGEATAKKIIDGRPYDALEDLLNVSGIGDATFEKFKDDICL